MMTTGALALRSTGCHLPSLTGARRFGLIHSESRSSLLAVIFVQSAIFAYYNPAYRWDEGPNVELRERWYTDVGIYEELAQQMTPDQWNRLTILLVHVERFRNHDFRALWPPVDDNFNLPPYPSHINDSDTVFLNWKPQWEHVRLALEHSASAVYPRLFYLDAPDNWFNVDYLGPGLAQWTERSPVTIEIHTATNTQWVAWASDILRRVL